MNTWQFCLCFKLISCINRSNSRIHITVTTTNVIRIKYPFKNFADMLSRRPTKLRTKFKILSFVKWQKWLHYRRYVLRCHFQFQNNIDKWTSSTTSVLGETCKFYCSWKTTHENIIRRMQLGSRTVGKVVTWQDGVQMREEMVVKGIRKIKKRNN